MKAILGEDEDGYPKITLIPSDEEREHWSRLTAQLNAYENEFEVTAYTELNKTIYGITTDPDGCVMTMRNKMPLVEIRLFEAVSILDTLRPKEEK